MEISIPQIVLFLAGLTIYLLKPSWLMLLWLISTPLLGPFIVFFSGVTDFQEQQEMVWGLWGVYNRLFMLIIFFNLFRRYRLVRNIQSILLPTALLLFYLVVHNLITHFYPTTILNETLSVVYTLVPLFVFLIDKKMWPSLKGLFIVAIVICVVQLLFIPLNLQGIFTYSGRYQEILEGGTEALLMSGTFTRSNMMADYLSVIYMFITIDFFSRKSLSIFQFIIVSVIIWIPLLFAGSKMPIVATVVNVFLCFALFNRKKFALVGVVILLFLGLLNFLQSNNSGEVSSIDGVNRVVGEMSAFTQSKSKKGGDDESTFKFSTDLIERYYWDAPLFGHGNAYKNDEYAYYSILDTSGLKTDATLAFYLVEYGIIGLCIYLFFQFKLLSFSSFSIPPTIRRQVVLMIFTFFFLFAFTERGLFDKNYFIFIFTYMFGLARYYNEHVRLNSANSIK